MRIEPKHKAKVKARHRLANLRGAKKTRTERKLAKRNCKRARKNAPQVLTVDQVTLHQANEVRFQRDVMRQPKAADAIAALSPEEYAEKKKLKIANPGDVAEAKALFLQFHGSESTEILEVQRSDAYRQTLTTLGPCIDLVVLGENGLVDVTFADLVEGRDGKAVDVEYNETPPTLAASPNGRQLYILGGQQTMTGEIITETFGADASKDLVMLGWAVSVTYYAAKTFDAGTGWGYEHELGEDGGVEPALVYDSLKKELALVGGSYHVDDWIRN